MSHARSTLRGIDSFKAFSAATADLPPLDLVAIGAAMAREAELTKPHGSLGRLESLVAWLAGVQARHPPRLDRAQITVFAGHHGIVAHGVSAYPAEVTGQMVASFLAGGAAINQLALTAGAELRVVEVLGKQSTADFTAGPAMSEADCCAALAAGAAAVEPGLDLLAIGEMGIGNTTSAAAIGALLFDEPAHAWAGPGTGLDAEGIARKVAVIERARTLHRSCRAAPLRLLAAVGGHEIAAMVGAIVEARLLGVPVLLDGFVCGAAACIADAQDRTLLAHCQAAHLSAEPAHRRLLAKLGLSPLLDLGMRLGEATGAALAIHLVRAAHACHQGMATFAEAKVATAVTPGAVKPEVVRP